MNEDQYSDLDKRIEVLRSDMNTNQAKYEGALERFRTDMAKWQTEYEGTLERFRTDMAKWQIENEKRDKANLLWTMTIVGVGIGLLGFVMNFMIRAAIAI